MRVAYQGEPGAYGEEAIAALWADGSIPLSVRTFEEVVRAIHDGDADAGVLPVENSLVGPVTAGVSALSRATTLRIVGETTVTIHHCLCGVQGATVAGLRRIASHPVALAQCRDFLARHPHIAAETSHDTAGAAREVAELGDVTVAAIAGRRAADRYGLDVIAERIADSPLNRTRFVALMR
jgi:prephenate dehydratase